MVCSSCAVEECLFCCKQKTAYEMRISDWSSDVCSSDLSAAGATSLDALSSAMASEPAEAGAADAGETAAPTAGSESWQPPSRTTRNSRGAMRTGNFIE